MRGSDTSYCLGKPRNRAVIACQEFEKCQEGICVRVYDNLCDMRCDEDGYDDYYCTQGSCGDSDVRTTINGYCADWGPTCCCTNG